MRSNFVLFGVTHWLIILSVPLIAWLLTRAPAAATTRYALGALLAVNELAHYAWKIQKGWLLFPGGLPLQLCDLIVWLTVFSLFTLNRWTFEFAFFAGLIGTGMAVLTPDLQQPWPSFETISFFVAHGGIVIALLYLWWSKQAAPEPGCLLRVMLMLNGYALAIAVFNAIFQTNYMYLCRKPDGASLLDYLGPWPVYILGGELVALTFFSLLWLPFRRRASANALP